MKTLRTLFTFSAIALMGMTTAACTQTAGGGFGGSPFGSVRQGALAVGGAVGGGFGGGAIARSAGMSQGWETAMTAAGAIVGGMLGTSIGQSLDDMDRMTAQRATMVALQNNQPMQWNSERNSGSGGQVYPGPIQMTPRGECRPYQTVIYINGRSEQAEGTACRGPNGTWQVQ
jgi:surface antigen